MVTNSNSEKRLIQGYVKHLRVEYLLKNIQLTCEKTNKKFILLKKIATNFEKLSKMVSFESSGEMISRNLSKNDINFGAEMFMALNSCPSFFVKLYWKVIYYGNESRIAQLSTNIIRKAKDDFKIRAQRIFAKISSVIGFQHISYHHEGNRSIAMNIELSKNMDVNGD